MTHGISKGKLMTNTEQHSRLYKFRFQYVCTDIITSLNAGRLTLTAALLIEFNSNIRLRSILHSPDHVVEHFSWVIEMLNEVEIDGM